MIGNDCVLYREKRQDEQAHCKSHSLPKFHSKSPCLRSSNKVDLIKVFNYIYTSNDFESTTRCNHIHTYMHMFETVTYLKKFIHY